jgi:thiol-disulfide isomerase/thioredoxin
MQTWGLLFAGFITFIAGLGLHLFQHSSSSEESRLLSATQLNDIKNKPHLLAEWSNHRLLILNFWATWCPSCLTEIAEFNRLSHQYSSSIQIIGIAIDDNNAVKSYIKHSPIDYPILIAGNAGINVAKAWGNSIGVVPFTVIIYQGQIVYRQFGEFNHSQTLLNQIRPWLISN